MKRTIPYIAAITVLMCILCLFAGCGTSKKTADVDPSLIAGKWENTREDKTGTYIFNADGTYTSNTVTEVPVHISVDDKGTWSVSGNTLSVYYESVDYTYEYTVAVSGNTMTWDSGTGSDNAVRTFIKK